MEIKLSHILWIEKKCYTIEQNLQTETSNHFQTCFFLPFSWFSYTFLSSQGLVDSPKIHFHVPKHSILVSILDPLTLQAFFFKYRLDFGSSVNMYHVVCILIILTLASHISLPLMSTLLSPTIFFFTFVYIYSLVVTRNICPWVENWSLVDIVVTQLDSYSLSHIFHQ